MNSYFTSGSNRPFFGKSDNSKLVDTSPNVDIHSVNPMIQLGFLMSLVGQTEPLPFESVFTPRRLEGIFRIGIGSYSEVYGFEGEDIVLKLTPFGGGVPFHNRPQVNISEMYMEIAATMEISNLRNTHDSSCKTENFTQLKNSVILVGSLPTHIISAKRKSNESTPLQYVEENKFPDDQLWVAFEFNYGGESISHYWPSCPVARLSVLLQTALGLAVGERRLKMEHRDLHLGNVLVSDNAQGCTHTPSPSYINGVKYQPLGGPSTQIIDFACARIQKPDGSTLYVDMTEKCERLRREGIVGQIYSMMQSITRNQWSDYHPRTNIQWLGLLAIWLMDSDKGVECDIHKDFDAEECRQAMIRLLSGCESALEFVHRARKRFDFLLI